MKNIVVSFFRLNMIITVLCICFSQLSWAQAVAPAQDSTAQNQPLKYVKIEVGMHILDCPVLPPQLKERLMMIKGIRDYTVNLKSETILFAIPEGSVTKDQIVNIAVRSGFPISAVNVIMNDKPFVN